MSLHEMSTVQATLSMRPTTEGPAVPVKGNMVALVLKERPKWTMFQATALLGSTDAGAPGLRTVEGPQAS